jgi:hypothetical protein
MDKPLTTFDTTLFSLLAKPPDGPDHRGHWWLAISLHTDRNILLDCGSFDNSTTLDVQLDIDWRHESRILSDPFKQSQN